MKKYVFILATLVLFASSAYAEEWTGTIRENASGQPVLSSGNNMFQLVDTTTVAMRYRWQQVRVEGTLDENSNTIRVLTIQPIQPGIQAPEPGIQAVQPADSVEVSSFAYDMEDQPAKKKKKKHFL